jgi:ATP-binding cassette subfamily B (MDR/TAP) protein 1
LATKKGTIAGLSFGFSNFVMFAMYSIIFYTGAIFVRDTGLDMVDMFTAIFAIMFAAFGAGNNA